MKTLTEFTEALVKGNANSKINNNLNIDDIVKDICDHSADLGYLYKKGDKCLLISLNYNSKNPCAIVKVATITGTTKTLVKYNYLTQVYGKDTEVKEKSAQLKLQSKSDKLPSNSNWVESTTILPHMLSVKAMQYIRKNKRIGEKYYFAHSYNYIEKPEDEDTVWIAMIDTSGGLNNEKFVKCTDEMLDKLTRGL